MALDRTPHFLDERVDDFDPIHDLAVLHVFRQQHAATGLSGALNYERIPIRESAQLLKINRGENVLDRRFDDRESGIELDLAARHTRVEMQLSCSSVEVLAQDLERNHAAALPPMLHD